ncbi:hypothetical protein CBS63078_2665 [Aspergillus niger]|nr:hypothetical protein CBS133816_3107 [Aspergillus niger]KAI2866034.1 hypothetical protein CBS12448_1557 [Aspergillus niger]KAI2922554.1 hypothetical protein CBS147371_2126 [Aspergillus niger]KAI2923117.1 hypothetical protein CBS63078_2665 [Aspergillus niger]KAI2946440.1 hypothetical protein CBS147321_3381 [Aspergillus niger]
MPAIRSATLSRGAGKEMTNIGLPAHDLSNLPPFIPELPDINLASLDSYSREISTFVSVVKSPMQLAKAEVHSSSPMLGPKQ